MPSERHITPANDRFEWADREGDTGLIYRDKHAWATLQVRDSEGRDCEVYLEIVEAEILRDWLDAVLTREAK